ncbi:MAG: hypothetical protein HY744_21305 [Deltaproteobacteria bacterium]|nr:hypothetical protein [Deltaproteobacteria bacterium]
MRGRTANFTNTGGLYDPVSKTWTPTTTTNAPTGRAYAVPLWTGSRMLVWGGVDVSGKVVNTGGIYTPP